MELDVARPRRRRRLPGSRRHSRRRSCAGDVRRKIPTRLPRKRAIRRITAGTADTTKELNREHRDPPRTARSRTGGDAVSAKGKRHPRIRVCRDASRPIPGHIPWSRHLPEIHRGSRPRTAGHAPRGDPASVLLPGPAAGCAVVDSDLPSERFPQRSARPAGHRPDLEPRSGAGRDLRTPVGRRPPGFRGLCSRRERVGQALVRRTPASCLARRPTAAARSAPPPSVRIARPTPWTGRSASADVDNHAEILFIGNDTPTPELPERRKATPIEGVLYIGDDGTVRHPGT